MNIVQLHERVRFWCDRVNSPRFDYTAIDNAINDGIKELVDEKYDASKSNHKGDSFQRTQRVRDELWSLVAKNDTDTDLILAGNLITKASVDALSDRYKYLLAASAEFTGTAGTYTLPLFPLSYDRRNMIARNPFRRSSLGPMSLAYYIESKEGIEIIGPEGINPDIVTLYYLKEPIAVRFGEEKTGPFADLEVVIATSLTAVYDSITYLLGDLITIVTAKGLSLTSGLAVHLYINSDIPETLHDEISVKAAVALLVVAEMDEKVKVLTEKIMAT